MCFGYGGKSKGEVWGNFEVLKPTKNPRRFSQTNGANRFIWV